MGTTLKRIIISGWQNFSRDGGIAVATIFILVMVIFLVSTIFLSKDVSQFLTNVLQEKVDISVYFKENAGEKDILNIKEDSNIVPMFFRKTDDKEEIEEDAFCDNVIDFPIKKKINFFSDMTDAQWSRAVLCMNNIHKPVTEQDEEYKKLHTGVSFLK